MQTVVECVPNFSEGRDPGIVEAIIAALLAGPDVYLLDKEMDADHNRSVITFVGTRDTVVEVDPFRRFSYCTQRRLSHALARSHEGNHRAAMRRVQFLFEQGNIRPGDERG